MRPYAVDPTTHQTVKAHLEPGAPAPPSSPRRIALQFLPRIRCNDCPGKLYTAVPGKVVEDFEVHLRNRNHRASVERRRAVQQLQEQGEGEQGGGGGK